MIMVTLSELCLEWTLLDQGLGIHVPRSLRDSEASGHLLQETATQDMASDT